jgi:hypothetical protein
LLEDNLRFESWNSSLWIDPNDDLSVGNVCSRLVHALSLPLQLDAHDAERFVDVFFDLVGLVGGEDD